MQCDDINRQESGSASTPKGKGNIFQFLQRAPVSLSVGVSCFLPKSRPLRIPPQFQADLLESFLQQFQLTHANPSFYRFFLLPQDGSPVSLKEIMRTWQEREQMQKLMMTGSCCFDQVVRQKDNGLWHLRSEWACSVDSAGRIEQVCGLQVDVSDFYRQQHALKRSRDDYRRLIEYSSDVKWVYNVGQRVFTFVSPAVESLLGYSVREMKGIDLYDLISKEDHDRMREHYALWSDQMKYPQRELDNPYIEVRLQPRRGEKIWCEIIAQLRLNEDGQLELIGTARNVERRKKNEDRIVYLSYHDQLTTLYNRHFFAAEFKRLDVQRNLPLSLIVADVNGLKATNDIFGHGAGDRVLMTVAELLLQACRADDIVARIGGDEFVVLLPSTRQEQAESLLGRMRELVEGAKLDQSILSVSFGIATKEEIGMAYADLFKVAEDQMYQEKVAERPRFEKRLFMHICHVFYDGNPAEQEHAQRVESLCRQMASQLGLAPDSIDSAALAGRYHDIGKIGVPSELVKKRGPLSQSDRVKLRQHSEVGYQILKTSKRHQPLAEHILLHHERPDGCGYPHGTSGRDITLPARIIAIAEAYDVMTQWRQKSKEEALMEIRRGAGRQFDAALAEAFIRMLNEDQAL